MPTDVNRTKYCSCCMSMVREQKNVGMIRGGHRWVPWLAAVCPGCDGEGGDLFFFPAPQDLVLPDKEEDEGND